jgi:hypothetical protein
MIVRVARFGEGHGRAKPGSLTLGADYVALAIEINPGRPHLVRVITDEGERHAALFELADFEIVDGHPSAVWSISQSDGDVSLAPATWGADSFWDDFYGDASEPKALAAIGDDRLAAVRLFDAAVAAMHVEAGLPWRNAPPVSSDIRAR